jgi:hypothetical protein
MGSWRTVYEVILPESGEAQPKSLTEKNQDGPKTESVAIDSGAKFRNGIIYHDIVGFREQLITPVNRDRFVRCFIIKLLTYANGEEPLESEFTELDRILAKSAEHDYRTVETIAAVIDSPLFRSK